MYTEEFDRRQFPFRDFLLKVILVIIFVFLLVWLLPKFITPSTKDMADISPLTSQVFGDNLEKMKNAAISYYTTERLPQTVGESHQMTLREMIANNLLIPFVDKNGKACDVDKSYVKITKEEQEYLLKVNLKCSDQEDYILVHLGCYNYCKSDVCERQATSVNQGATKPSSTVSISGNGNNNSSSNTANSNGSSNSSDSNSSNDNNSSNGGNGGQNSDNNKGNNPTPPEDNTLVYEYAKTAGAKYSEWTKWSSWQKNNDQLQAIECSDSDPTCLKQIKLLSRKEKLNETYSKPYKVARNEIRYVGSYQEVACSEYNYLRIDETTYKTTTTTQYTSWENITSQTNQTTGSWVFQGYVNQAGADTATTKYKLVGADFSNCSTTCTSLPTFRYAKYTLASSLSNVTAANSPSTSSLTSSSGTKSVHTSINAVCSNVTTKNVPVYRTITVYDIQYRDEPLYGTVTYYSVKTRKVVSKGKTTTKWSSYNDTSLLNNGYHYTGNTKKK